MKNKFINLKHILIFTSFSILNIVYLLSFNYNLLHTLIVNILITLTFIFINYLYTKRNLYINNKDIITNSNKYVNKTIKDLFKYLILIIYTFVLILLISIIINKQQLIVSSLIFLTTTYILTSIKYIITNIYEYLRYKEEINVSSNKYSLISKEVLIPLSLFSVFTVIHLLIKINNFYVFFNNYVNIIGKEYLLLTMIYQSLFIVLTTFIIIKSLIIIYPNLKKLIYTVFFIWYIKILLNIVSELFNFINIDYSSFQIYYMYITSILSIILILSAIIFVVKIKLEKLVLWILVIVNQLIYYIYKTVIVNQLIKDSYDYMYILKVSLSSKYIELLSLLIKLTLIFIIVNKYQKINKKIEETSI